MNQDLLERFKAVRSDPWEFASNLVYTKDEIDLKNPIKKFPSELGYLKLYFKVWQRERLLAVPKSRRMFLSWATLILFLHDTMFNIGRQVAVVSKKEEDADELLERMRFILENLEKDAEKGGIPKELIPKWKKTFCCLEFPEIDSRILAFPSGADQLRSYAASGILGDESAFWPNAEEMYSATFPTIELLGRMTMISSAAPGFFKKLVHDELNGEEVDLNFDSRKKFPMEGIEIWKNPKNGFCVFQIHYTANPDKRNPKYSQTMKSAMPLSKYNQEFEISWETFAGKPVFPDWNKNIHGCRETIYPHIGLPLLVGVDFGLTPSAAIGQVQGGKLVIFDELVTENMGAERFTELLKKHISTNYSAWGDTKNNVVMWIDPAGFQRSQTDETTCAQKLSKYFKPQPGGITFVERQSAVEHFLCGMAGGKPNFIVDLTRCKKLSGGFDGGYHWDEKDFDVEPEKLRPEKNSYSHIHDGLQYLCTGILRKGIVRPGNIPAPSYSGR